MWKRALGNRRSHARTVATFLLVLFALNLTSLTTYSDDVSVVSTATAEGRLAVFDDVWETIFERYYDPALNGVDWHARRASYRVAAAKANGTAELYDVLRQLIAPLNDAHTRVYSPEEKFEWWSPRFIATGLSVRLIEGAPTVVNVEKDSLAAKSGIRPGDVITTVDSKPAEEVLKQNAQHTRVTSTSRSVTALLDGPAGSTVNIGWRDREGKTRAVTLQRYWSQRQLGFSSGRKDKFVIIRLDAFTQTVVGDFLKALPDMIKDADGIVLDLRGNGGGDAEAMADVASLFLKDGINLGRFADRSGASFELQTYFKRVWRLPITSQIELPLVVITGESTGSAAEILVSALQTAKRARVIGNNTCGCVLAIRTRHALPDGGVLDVSEFNYHTAQGVRLEGRGIKPDQVVSLRRRELYERRDPAIEIARTYLDKLKK
jgi:carboxyl-terminal processing protease